MNIISLFLLILIPVSIVFAVVALIKMLKYKRGGSSNDLRQRDLKYRPRRRLIVSSLVVVACFAVLFFYGKLYSLAMTIQMPSITGILSDGNINDNIDEIRLNSDNEFELTGNRAVVFNYNFGAGTNWGQEVFLSIDGFIGEHLFRYSDDYIPEVYRTASASDVGYIVFIRHSAADSGQRYTNGAKAYIHIIEVIICDDRNILAEKTFKGGVAPSTTQSETLGPAPDREVSEWVAQQLDRITSQKPEPGGGDDAVDDAGENLANTWTAEGYSAYLERAAIEAGISLLPGEQLGNTYFFYLADIATRDEHIEISEAQAGLSVNTYVRKDSLMTTDKLKVYLLILHAASIADSIATRIVDDINTEMIDMLDNDSKKFIQLSYPDNGVIVEIAYRNGIWNVDFIIKESP